MQKFIYFFFVSQYYWRQNILIHPCTHIQFLCTWCQIFSWSSHWQQTARLHGLDVQTLCYTTLWNISQFLSTAPLESRNPSNQDCGGYSCDIWRAEWWVCGWYSCPTGNKSTTVTYSSVRLRVVLSVGAITELTFHKAVKTASVLHWHIKQ